MIDIALPWGSDFAVGATGDLALANVTDTISQRICRRLLTNAGDYVWQLDYGASLGTFVGSPADPASVEAVIRSQIAMEAAVPSSPAPEISVVTRDQANGIVVATITYADPATMVPVEVNVAVPSGAAS